MDMCVCVCVCVCARARAHLCMLSLSTIWLCDPMSHNLAGSSIHGIVQARILEWVAITYSRGSLGYLIVSKLCYARN